jgi:steroid delta-isomerase-like uncharacterized protein
MNVEDNLKVAESLNEAFNTRNWDMFDERHTDDIIAYSPITPEPTRGIKEHRQQVEGLLEAFPDFKITLERSFGQDEWVCAEYRLTGTHKGTLRGQNGNDIPATNKPVDMTFVTTIKFRDGKISEEHSYWDRMELLEQLGIAPKP